jgi:hypothetical protein
MHLLMGKSKAKVIYERKRPQKLIKNVEGYDGMGVKRNMYEMGACFLCVRITDPC